MLERALALWNQMPDPVATTGGDRADPGSRRLGRHRCGRARARALALVDAALDEVDAVAEPLRRADLLEQRAKLLSEVAGPRPRPW